MSMGIGTNARKPDEGKLKRENLREVACGVWFTSTGTAMRKMIKYEHDEGMIRSVGRRSTTAASPSMSTGAAQWRRGRNTFSVCIIMQKKTGGN